jgi:hypothetical protein
MANWNISRNTGWRSKNCHTNVLISCKLRDATRCHSFELVYALPLWRNRFYILLFDNFERWLCTCWLEMLTVVYVCTCICRNTRTRAQTRAHTHTHKRERVLRLGEFNPLTPELNLSAQRCLTRCLLGILLLEPCISLIYAWKTNKYTIYSVY